MAFRTDASTEGLTRTTSFPSSTSFTIAGWVMVRGSGEGTWESLFSLISSGGSSYSVLYKRISGNTGVCVLGSSGQADLGVVLSTDTWYYVALGSNGTTGTSLTGWVITTSGTVYTASTWGVSYTPVEMSVLNNTVWSEWV